MRKTRKAALIITIAMAVTPANSAFAANRPGSDWKDQVVRAMRDNDPLSRFIKYVKHLISKLDEPQGPPPLPDGPGN